MRDRDIADAIVDGDPAGLAAAYDGYAAGLHAYCQTMLADPDDAADVVQDIFVIADAKLGALRDPDRLRPWLYAVARNECHRRIRSRTGPGGPDEAGDLTDAGGAWVDRDELRGLVLAAIDGLSAGDREIIELTLRHELDGADLADALDVPGSQADALASRARAQLDRSLGVLLAARTGRRQCADLDELLAGWDGWLASLPRQRVSRHIENCAICGARRHRELSPVMLLSVLPLRPVSPGLRHQVLRLVTDDSPDAARYRHLVARRAEPFGPYGFPVQIVPAAQLAPSWPDGDAATGDWNRPGPPPEDRADDDVGRGRGRHDRPPGAPGLAGLDGDILRGTRTRLIALGTVAALVILLGGGGTAYLLLGRGRQAGLAAQAAHQAAPADGVVTTLPAAAPASGPGSARPRPSSSASAIPGPSVSAASSPSAAPSRRPGTPTPSGAPSTVPPSPPATPPPSASAPPVTSTPSPSPPAGTLTESPATVTLAPSAAGGGAYTGTFALTATGGPVACTVAGPRGEPYLTVSPASATLAAGDTETFTVSLSPAAGSTPPFDSTLTVDPGGLTVTVEYPPSG